MARAGASETQTSAQYWYNTMLHEIINLDCSIKQNRIHLVKRVMKALKLEAKPSLEKLEKLSNKLGDKYLMHANIYDNNLVIHVKTGYSIMTVNSTYEAYCKHILYIKEYLRYEKSVKTYSNV